MAAMAGGRPYPPLLGTAALLLAGTPLCAGQSVFFETMQYREPGQCERHQCLSQRLTECRDHLEGSYLKEKGCTNGQICTKCTYPGQNDSQPTICICENPPYSVTAHYNQECNIGAVCSTGQCFRPCHTFLHATLCPKGHCQWDTSSEACIGKIAEIPTYKWTATPTGTPTIPIVYEDQGQYIVASTHASFLPMKFSYFKESAEGYRINGILVNNITSFETMFALLDIDGDGRLNTIEFGGLPAMLTKLAATARRLKEEEPDDGLSPEARRLTAQVCGSQGKFYCSFDAACKDDCEQCGWKSAHDRAFSQCTVPTPDVCNADQGRVFCSSDDLCKKDGCSDCLGKPEVDFSQHTCLARWWDPEPLTTWSNWVCRYRHESGMPCTHDQDCISGLRRCLGGSCQPMAPYDVNHKCASDHDCPHIGYYCPADPTDGENQYWVQYCRRQGDVGTFCKADRDCQPELGCNLAEFNPTCQRFFSLGIGFLASSDDLCEFGWRDRDGRCAPAAKSKNVGGACDTDADCVTTDATGRTGQCVCKVWWQESDSRYCEPVAGDYDNHFEKYRNYLWFKVVNCGNHWNEEECLNVFGNEAVRLKYDFECEKQKLVNGPFLPPPDCGIQADDPRFVDACARLDAAR